MATIAPFSIPFSRPYTLDEDIKFRAFYTGEPLHYVHKLVVAIASVSNPSIARGSSNKLKCRKTTFWIVQGLSILTCP